jgi:hypothetical protein
VTLTPPSTSYHTLRRSQQKLRHSQQKLRNSQQKLRNSQQKLSIFLQILVNFKLRLALPSPA